MLAVRVPCTMLVRVHRHEHITGVNVALLRRRHGKRVSARVARRHFARRRRRRRRRRRLGHLGVFTVRRRRCVVLVECVLHRRRADDAMETAHLDSIRLCTRWAGRIVD